VHPVEHRVRARVKVARALRDIREQVEKPLPARAHGELGMSSVAMQKKRLAEHGRVPMGEEKQGDEHVGFRF
jgi:hypothetical protein